MTILLSNADHDTWTSYLQSWSDKIRDAASKRDGVLLVELSGPQATRENIEAAIEEHKPDLVIINGHGAPDIVYGHELRVLVHADENPEVLAGRVTQAISCWTADELGVKAVTAGARSYIGFSEKIFIWCEGRASHADRLQDDYAKLFFDPVFETAIALVEGCDSQAALKRGQDRYAVALDVVTRSSMRNKMDVAAQLFHQLSCFKLLGDGSAAC